jgi:hypothetical protein
MSIQLHNTSVTAFQYGNCITLLILADHIYRLQVLVPCNSPSQNWKLGFKLQPEFRIYSFYGNTLDLENKSHMSAVSTLSDWGVGTWIPNSRSPNMAWFKQWASSPRCSPFGDSRHYIYSYFSYILPSRIKSRLAETKFHCSKPCHSFHLKHK